jgi:squalene-associated FAD-dependent desaturase
MPCESVIVMGGGLAGLSSAVALAESGLRVCLLEKRPHLGGRAASYALPDGSHVDNCQHVTLGCCTNLADFYRRAGAGGKIRRYDRLLFADGSGERSQMGASWLPAPFHLALSFLRFGALEWRDKRGIVALLMKLVRSGGQPGDAAGVPMLDWLRRHGQTQAAISRFWATVLVSALNEELVRTDAQYGVDVFWKTFLANRRGFTLGIPAVPLGNLYDGCRAAIESRGGSVRCRTGVKQVLATEGRFAGVVTESGEEISADAGIAAVTHDVLLEVLPPEVVERSVVLQNLRRLRVSPITSAHLWFDRPVMTEPFVAVLDKTIQWIFNKSLLHKTPNGLSTPESVATEAGGEGARPAAQYLQAVISASYGLVRKSRQEIVDLCVSEIAEVLPAARNARLIKATVIKEVAATFSPEPGVDQWRTGPESPLASLWLAGDWTRTGWPATMEGAVRSGYRAAEALLQSRGAPRKFVQPDLPVEGLAHWLSAGKNLSGILED